jgi:hypothetical protein
MIPHVLLLLFSVAHGATEPSSSAPASPPVQVSAVPVQAPSRAQVVEAGMVVVGEKARALLGAEIPSTWTSVVMETLSRAGLPARSADSEFLQASRTASRWTLTATIDDATSARTGLGLEVETRVTWHLWDAERNAVICTVTTSGRAVQSGQDLTGRLMGAAAEDLARHSSFRQALAGQLQVAPEAAPQGTLAADAFAWRHNVRKRDWGLGLGTVGVATGAVTVIVTKQAFETYVLLNETMPEKTWTGLYVANTAGWIMIGGGAVCGAYGLLHMRSRPAHILAGPGFAGMTGTF